MAEQERDERLQDLEYRCDAMQETIDALVLYVQASHAGAANVVELAASHHRPVEVE